MRIERHVDSHAFPAVAAPLAAGNAPLSAFLHACVDRLIRAGVVDCCFMAAADDEGFALQRDDGPVFLAACTTRSPTAFAEEAFVVYVFDDAP